MAHNFLALTFTPSVRAAQARYYGSARSAPTASGPDVLTAEETDFLASRDSFYMATVTADGWPYVQHRGGPPGFVKVVGPNRIGFADFGGNRQLLTTGNLTHNHRVALFFMDYARRERLKILGEVQVLDARHERALADELTPAAGLRSSVERIFLIEVIAFDWNCPKYIPPRYTEADLEARLAPLRQRIEELEQRTQP